MTPAAPTTPAAAAQDFWLAGLDAFSQATKAATEAASQVATLATSASTSPPGLEGLFEARVAKALGRLGTPTREEVDALSAQVQHLQAALQAALNALDPKGNKPAAKTAKRKKTTG